MSNDESIDLQHLKPEPLKIELLQPAYEHCFTPEARASLETKLSTLMEYDEGVVGRELPKPISATIFLSVSVRDGKYKYQAIGALIDVVNALAAKGFIRGHLALLSSISLAVIDTHSTTAYFIMPHIAYEHLEEAKAIAGVFSVSEGEVGPVFTPNVITQHCRSRGSSDT